MDSILDSTKKALLIETTNLAFDSSIILHINSVFATISQLGIGPVVGFAIEDNSAVWSDFIGDDPRLNDIKQYVYLRTRIVFDPPVTTHLLNSTKELIQELEWRMSIRREGDSWVEPQPVPALLEPEVIIVPVSQAWTSE